MNIDPQNKPQINKASETEAWKNMVDSIIDFLSASRTMLQILTEKLEIAEEEKADDKQKTLEERIRQKFLNEFLHIDVKRDEDLKEIHVNKLFNENTGSNSKAVFEMQLNERFANVPKARPTNEFLDKQYNLTKQAIARRYQPQSKVNIPMMKNNNYSKRDYLTETFTEGLHRISNVASESIQMDRRIKCDEKPLKTPKIRAGPSSHEQTYVIYQKF